MKKAIIIYTGAFNSIKIKKNGLELTAKTETELKKLLEAQAQINEILDQVKETMGFAMEQANTNLVERGDIRITKSVTGRRFSIDPKNKADEKYLQTTSYEQPNPEMIDAYIAIKGKIPKGILENARKQKVDIKIIQS